MSSRRRQARLRIAAIALAAIAASVALAACGDDDSDSDTTAAGSTTAAGGAETISVQSVGGLEALVDAEGKVLYTNDLDTGKKVTCTAECAVDWVPVTSGSGEPTSDDPSVAAKLGVVTNPEGASQVTYEGKPLYTFIQDPPGEVTGNGFVDTFAGVTFTWTAATARGAQPGAGAATTTETETESETESETTTEEDSGAGSGGYGY
jgi:predicted lipoprotein with Yx(FWY)xxD motif